MKEWAQSEIGLHTSARTKKNVTMTKQLDYLPTLQSQKKSHELLNITKMEPKSATKQQQNRTLFNNVINTGKGNKNSTLKVKTILM